MLRQRVGDIAQELIAEPRRDRAGGIHHGGEFVIG
jgi:hypothetical protein